MQSSGSHSEPWERMRALGRVGSTGRRVKSELVGRNGENVASEIGGRQEGGCRNNPLVRKVRRHRTGLGQEA